MADQQLPVVSVQVSATIGDGQMNFRKAQVSLSMPTSVEEIDDTYTAIKDFCQGNLKELVEEMLADNPGMTEADGDDGSDLDADL
jgi:hypothetical protein